MNLWVPLRHISFEASRPLAFPSVHSDDVPSYLPRAQRDRDLRCLRGKKPQTLYCSPYYFVSRVLIDTVLVWKQCFGSSPKIRSI